MVNGNVLRGRIIVPYRRTNLFEVFLRYYVQFCAQKEALRIRIMCNRISD